jgi:hypothetical protein
MLVCPEMSVPVVGAKHTRENSIHSSIVVRNKSPQGFCSLIPAVSGIELDPYAVAL